MKIIKTAWVALFLLCAMGSTGLLADAPPDLLAKEQGILSIPASEPAPLKPLTGLVPYTEAKETFAPNPLTIASATSINLYSPDLAPLGPNPKKRKPWDPVETAHNQTPPPQINLEPEPAPQVEKPADLTPEPEPEPVVKNPPPQEEPKQDVTYSAIAPWIEWMKNNPEAAQQARQTAQDAMTPPARSQQDILDQDLFLKIRFPYTGASPQPQGSAAAIYSSPAAP